ncbi:hypothetical protein C8R44DRAFT_957566 [Mycena epipterygia]|nr:hypothetical protein C8R44DRAFT_957566 [Mycena epipterygia]
MQRDWRTKTTEAPVSTAPICSAEDEIDEFKGGAEYESHPWRRQKFQIIWEDSEVANRASCAIGGILWASRFRVESQEYRMHYWNPRTGWMLQCRGEACEGKKQDAGSAAAVEVRFALLTAFGIRTGYMWNPNWLHGQKYLLCTAKLFLSDRSIPSYSRAYAVTSLVILVWTALHSPPHVSYVADQLSIAGSGVARVREQPSQSWPVSYPTKGTYLFTAWLPFRARPWHNSVHLRTNPFFYTAIRITRRSRWEIDGASRAPPSIHLDDIEDNRFAPFQIARGDSDYHFRPHNLTPDARPSKDEIRVFQDIRCWHHSEVRQPLTFVQRMPRWYALPLHYSRPVRCRSSRAISLRWLSLLSNLEELAARSIPLQHPPLKAPIPKLFTPAASIMSFIAPWFVRRPLMRTALLSDMRMSVPVPNPRRML